MARRKELRGPTVLLCERCGYDLTGTPQDLACPECGTPVGDSLPARRRGTPFQQSPGIVSLLRTIWMVIRHPRTMWRDVRVEAPWSTVFGGTCIVFASCYSWFGMVLLSRARAAHHLDALIVIVLGIVFLALLTAIEFIGLQIIGRKNGWRVTSAVSCAICGHACVGWLVVGVLVAIGWRIGAHLPAAPLTNNTPSWMNPIVTSLQFVLPGIGFFIGMMVFETLAYIGVRRMRWANVVVEETKRRRDKETE